MVINRQLDHVFGQKIEHWKNKLIDLSKRNNLISYNFTKSKSIKFTSPNLDEAFEYIIWEKTITILKRKSDAKSRAKHWLASEEDELVSKKLHNIYLKSSSSIREMGINTCFLALFFLKYSETDNSDTYSTAPIFLIPSEIKKTKSRSKSIHNYEISVESDDLFLNPALVEKMSSEHKLELEKFGDNQSVFDYIEYLNDITQECRKWEIINDVILDIFSYQKIVMYEDISKNIPLIKSNPLIRGYLGDPYALLGELKEPPGYEHHDSNDVEVLPADSSQKRAIELARAGTTFVLQGPPGTGKSQTICNMITALIEDNKRVLFVSQKKAALDVVLKRLSEIGMDRYCLNLHEYGGSKKEIVQQLLDELNTSPKITDKYKRYNFSKYLTDQSTINEFYTELCKKQDIRNLSIYNIRGLIAQLHDVELIVSDLTNVLNSSGEEYIKIIDQLEKLSIILNDVENPLKSSYYYYNKENNIIKRTELIQVNNELNNNINNINKIIEQILNETNFKFMSIKDLDKFNDIHFTFKRLKKPPEFLISEDFYSFYEELLKIYKSLKEIDESKGKIVKNMYEKFLKTDPSSSLAIFEKTGFFGQLFNKEYKEIKKELVKLSKKKINHREYISILKEKIKYDYLIKEYDKILKEINYMDKSEEWNLNELKEINILYEHALSLKPIYDLIREINENFYPLVSYINKKEPILFEIANIENSIKKINKYFSINLFEDNRIDKLIDIYYEISLNIDNIDKILYFREIYEKINNQLQSFIIQYIEQKTNDSITRVFEKSYYIQLHEYLSRSSPLNSPKKEIDSFQKLDIEVRDVKRFKIMEKLEGNQPSYTLPSSGNERAILIREGEKKRRLKPIRQLLSEIPNLVFVLKPCFMMSPLTVSQYIQPGIIDFDVVIFDEASQIMPEDAIPCLMRAKQTVIMGDTQQLPPTTFFQKIQEDDFVDDDVEDLPSFLSEASTRFRLEYLNWHYRSRNENLIAFSNYHFYNNRLITFPNAQRGDNSGIDFVYVENAIYDRGRTRMNVLEANKVVDVFLRLREEYAEKSFGIVAFGISQETAIREAFERKQIDLHESLNSTQEDLFIRNLETVQGDERDIIILSVGYGKDARGILTYNFGPLNRDDGYKRLNVAITRSRLKTVVVCSFHPEELADERMAPSLRYLKNYLLFAKYKDFKKFVSNTDIGFDSEFEEAVYYTLVGEGYDVEVQVGYSGYRVDLAIKHPERPGEYILGIECDGSQYNSSKFARDRDKVRQVVLERLGWNIHRIWSEDWIKDQQGELSKISQKIEKLVKKRKNWLKEEDIKFTPVESMEVKKADFNSKFETYTKSNHRIFGWDVDQYTSYGNKRVTYDTRINDAFINVLKTEGPMDIELLFIRVAEVLNKKRGSRINNIFNDVLNDLKKRRIIFQRGSTVHSSPIPKLTTIRISNEKDRKFIYIPKEEIGSAIIEILKNNFTSDADSLKQDVSKAIYNIKRRNQKTDKKIDETILYLTKIKMIKEEDSKISLIS